MNLTSQTEIKKLLNEIGANPKKHYGQNFLVNKGILEKIITYSDINEDDIILEIGPGLGTLTKELSKKAKKVIVIEKDFDMLNILKKVLISENIKNVEIINGDVLKLDIAKLKIKKYKLIANIPYYLTSALIRKFLEEKLRPEKIILMMQKEVAQRICAKEKMNLLSLSVLFYATPKILFSVSKGSFWPIPNVDSVLIKITPNEKPLMEPSIFFKFIKAGFSSPRKLLISNLSENLKIDKEKMKDIFKKTNLDEKTRAEDLTIQNWLKLIHITIIKINLESRTPNDII
ncbi:MAG: 16S rRNA (adenine(1518)-N(6)/adenine(1519)-N(6))-dimethyltransferase RsmA [Patescibacteria group bacterium]